MLIKNGPSTHVRARRQNPYRSPDLAYLTRSPDSFERSRSSTETAATIGMTTAGGAVAGIAYAMLCAEPGMGALAVIAGAAIGGVTGTLISGVF